MGWTGGWGGKLIKKYLVLRVKQCYARQNFVNCGIFYMPARKSWSGRIEGRVCIICENSACYKR